MTRLARNAEPAPKQHGEVALTVLLFVEVLVIFLVIPLRKIGVLDAPLLAIAAVPVVVTALAVVGRRRGAAATLIVGAALVGVTSMAIEEKLPATLRIVLEAGSVIVFAVVLGWVISSAVFGPGEVTTHRVRGGILLYMKVAVIFAASYWLIADITPGAFAAGSDKGPLKDVADAIYFSFATLTTVGYGDIVPVHPLARSLANLEALLGQLFPATFIARLVTLELSARTRRREAAHDGDGVERRE